MLIYPQKSIEVSILLDKKSPTAELPHARVEATARLETGVDLVRQHHRDLVRGSVLQLLAD